MINLVHKQHIKAYFQSLAATRLTLKAQIITKTITQVAYIFSLSMA